MTETEENFLVESRPVTDFSNFDQSSSVEAAAGPSTVNIPQNMTIDYINTQRTSYTSTLNTSIRASEYDGEEKDDE